MKKQIVLAAQRGKKHVSLVAQRGFTLVEISVVSIILVVLVALAVPAINSYLIGGRVPTAGQDLTRAIVSLKQQAADTSSSTPFASVPGIAKLLANTNFTVNGTTVNHSLGDSAGEVQLAAVGSGAAAQLTVWGLHPSACPSLASSMSKAADVIEVGQSGTAAAPTAPTAASSVPSTTSTAVVKVPTVAYNAMSAQAACDTDGNHNYMRFYVKR
jgi:type IV pilus assembly protein PilA